MQTHRTVDEQRPAAASLDARHSASGAAAFGASSDRSSRQQPSRHRATAQGRHRGARQRIPERAPAEHDRRPRQGAERRPRQGRRSAVAHRERRRDREGPRGQMTIARTPRNRMTSEGTARTKSAGRPSRPALDDGPLQGTRIEAEVVEGRPPSTVDVACRRQQHVPLLPRGVGPERPVRDVHVPLPRVDAPRRTPVLPRACPARSRLATSHDVSSTHVAWPGYGEVDAISQIVTRIRRGFAASTRCRRPRARRPDHLAVYMGCCANRREGHVSAARATAGHCRGGEGPTDTPARRSGQASGGRSARRSRVVPCGCLD